MANKNEKQNDKGAKDDVREAPESGEPRNSGAARDPNRSSQAGNKSQKKPQSGSRR